MKNHGDIYKLPGIAPNHLIHPARAKGNEGLVAFLGEHSFWGIVQPVRRLMYCHANGVTVAHLNPSGANEILQSLKPNRDLLFAYFEGFEEAYEEVAVAGNGEGAAVNTNAVAHATTMVFDAARIRCRHNQITPHVESWCALALCAGIMACQKNRLSARHMIKRNASPIDFAESYLFRFVLGWSNDWDCLKQKNPLLRFIASCYPTTPLERQILPDLMDRVFHTAPLEITSESLWKLFDACFRLGQGTAWKNPKLLGYLLTDIETGIRPGCAAENARIFRQHLRLGSRSVPDPEDAWRGLVDLIVEQFPHLMLFHEHPAQIIHTLAFVQRILDGAFWSGLYSARPEAFENFETWQKQWRE